MIGITDKFIINNPYALNQTIIFKEKQCIMKIRFLKTGIYLGILNNYFRITWGNLVESLFVGLLVFFVLRGYFS